MESNLAVATWILCPAQGPCSWSLSLYTSFIVCNSSVSNCWIGCCLIHKSLNRGTKILNFYSVEFYFILIGLIASFGESTRLQYSCLENPMDRGAWRVWSMGSIRVAHDWVTSLSLFTFMHWRRKWQPTPVFLPGESQGQRSLAGWHLQGHTESDMTEVT